MGEVFSTGEGWESLHQSRKQSPFSIHPQDSSFPGNGREAGFSGVVVYGGRESD